MTPVYLSHELVAALGLAVRLRAERRWRILSRIGLAIAAGLIVYGAGALLASAPAPAKWKPEYAKADPEIRAWYRSQHNAQGQWCCDESDGHPFFGGYAINKDGSVTLDLAGGRKHTIPAYMVIAGPNPTGHAVWWFLIDGAGNHTDFCFAPGTLT